MNLAVWLVRCCCMTITIVVVVVVVRAALRSQYSASLTCGGVSLLQHPSTSNNNLHQNPSSPFHPRSIQPSLLAVLAASFIIPGPISSIQPSVFSAPANSRRPSPPHPRPRVLRRARPLSVVVLLYPVCHLCPDRLGCMRMRTPRVITICLDSHASSRRSKKQFLQLLLISILHPPR